MIQKIIKVYKSGGIIEIIIKTIKKLVHLIEKLVRKIIYQYYIKKYKNAPIYKNPSDEELKEIENDLQNLGIEIYSYYVDLDDFNKFKEKIRFPLDYHGGVTSGVFEEKLLEHYIAYKLLDMENLKSKPYVYIDVAANESPWAKLLREISDGKIMSYAIDLKKTKKFNNYDFYIECDATKTCFKDNSVDGISLQCAFEMFIGNSDIELIKEFKRILKPGGKAIISPLYMHTHPCHYTSPEFFGKGFGDEDSKEYIRWDCSGILSSRKYDAKKLKSRILDLISQMSMRYKVYVVRNKKQISTEIYMHFILEIQK